MLAGIILLIVGFIGLLFAFFIWKGHLNLIAGFNTLSEEEQNKVDKNKLKSYILRILLSIAIFLIEVGIVFIIKIIEPIAISIPIFLVVNSAVGILMYYVSDKFNFRFIDILHKILTMLVIIITPIIVVLFTFYI